MSGSPYSDSPMLNEIHTHFPALMYDSARFRTLSDVFRYVQAQLRARYDVFSNSQRRFQETDYSYRARHFDINNIQTTPVQATRDASSILTELFGQVAMNDPGTAMLFPMYAATTATTATTATAPTTGRPTHEQIHTATQIYSQQADSETPCAVCQDSIVSNNIVRKLNGCGHAFHLSCIDTWFQRSSQCPTCRNNIITPATAHAITPPAAP